MSIERPNPVSRQMPTTNDPTPTDDARGSPPGVANGPLVARKLPVATLTSLLLHIFVLSICALIVFKRPQLVEEIFTTITDSNETNQPLEEPMIMPPADESTTPEPPSSDSMTSLPFETKGPLNLDVSDSTPQLLSDPNGQAVGLEIKEGSETAGRMGANKMQMVRKFGGTSSSEASVAYGMKWLENHQWPNGSWNFVHSKHHACKNQCSQDGSFKDCPNGATGLALLALLGGGHTHLKGDHHVQVRKGIDFLLSAAKKTDAGLDLRGKLTANEGMYVQGLCTIALCECAAMTNDRKIKTAAEGAINFIIKAQNANDGGWRYNPGDAGDTSVVGWQVMALKAGHDARINFPTQTFRRAEGFLRLVQTDNGAGYKYEPAQTAPTDSMTAVGLLCRMYLGWDRSRKELMAGVDHLDKVKPMPNNMYYNYYATQVMHHWGGDEWTRWNELMRDQLVRTQHPAKDGHLAGSWDIADPHGPAGGRLYMTCLAVMTLEVYYRHLPMYDRERIKVEF